MGQELCISKERGSERCHSDCDLSEIEFIRFDYKKDQALLAPCLYEFEKDVNNTDYSGYELIEGIPFHKLDLWLCALKTKRVNFNLALHKGNCVAFLMYYLYAECILCVRGIYTYPEYEGKGIGAELIHSLDKPIKKVYFQSQKNLPPSQLFKHTASDRVLVHESDKLITWEFEWRAKNEHRRTRTIASSATRNNTIT